VKALSRAAYMGDVDWSRLLEATSKGNHPTPGYVVSEIVRDISHSSPHRIPAVATYLADCVDGDHAHVKLKALFITKALAYRVPPFCHCMRERLPSIKAACLFSGPPSPLFGDEPYRLVREAAEACVVALTGEEFYHEKYKEMSQRIVGFGNFQPDASEEVGVKIDYWELTSGAVGLLQSGVGALVMGFREMITGPFGSDREVEALDVDDYDDGGELTADDIAQAAVDSEEPPFLDNKDGSYQHSPGLYVPPSLPVPAESRTCGGNSLTASHLSRPPEALAADHVDSVLSEADILQALGLDSSWATSSIRGGDEEDDVFRESQLSPAVDNRNSSSSFPFILRSGQPAVAQSSPMLLPPMGEEVVANAPPPECHAARSCPATTISTTPVDKSGCFVGPGFASAGMMEL